MKPMLHQKGDYAFLDADVKTTTTETVEFLGEDGSCEFELHVVAKTIEDQLFRDAGEELRLALRDPRVLPLAIVTRAASRICSSRSRTRG